MRVVRSGSDAWLFDNMKIVSSNAKVWQRLSRAPARTHGTRLACVTLPVTIATGTH